jgi:hydroxymethylglutaryl-CoA lyase
MLPLTEVEIVEVGLRDGLQSLEQTLPTELKLELIDELGGTGITTIEIGSFVRPDVVPQLADTAELFARIVRRPGVAYRALCPNRKGAELACAAGADELLGMFTASEGYTRRNSNMSVAEALQQVIEMAAVAREAGIRFVASMGTCTFCPYDGEIGLETVLGLVDRMVAGGIEEVSLATTAGVDGPRTLHDLFAAVRERYPRLTLGAHLHDANGMALANALAALEAGATRFESSACGIGGGIRLPDGMQRRGNVATEDLVMMFDEIGCVPGIDADRVLAYARRFAERANLGEVFSAALQGGTKADVLAHGRK